MKRLLFAAAVGLGSLAGGSLIGVNDASAYGSPGCVSAAEFRRVTVGMAKPRVDRVFETKGTPKGRSQRGVRYAYSHCQPGLLVNVYYRPATMRVRSKTVTRLPVRDTPGCVTVAERSSIWEGMEITQVHAIFDTAGVVGQDIRHILYSRRYPFCAGELARGEFYVCYDRGDRVRQDELVGCSLPRT